MCTGKSWPSLARSVASADKSPRGRTWNCGPSSIRSIAISSETKAAISNAKANATSEMLGDPAGDVLPDQLLADFVDHLVPHSRMLLVLLIAAADPLKKLARRLGRGDPVLGAANDRD